jgi:hypothetical protein
VDRLVLAVELNRGVRDDRVQPAETADRRRDRSVEVVGPGDVADDGEPVGRGRDRLDCCGGPSERDDVAAPGGQITRRSGPDP